MCLTLGQVLHDVSDHGRGGKYYPNAGVFPPVMATFRLKQPTPADLLQWHREKNGSHCLSPDPAAGPSWAFSEDAINRW